VRYLALTTRGLARLRRANGADGSEIESGIYDLDQAASIRPLDNALEGERQAAINYQTALSYFGADWETTIQLLSALRPDYRDVGQKLYEANLQAGEAYSTSQQFCKAELYFTSAISLTGDSRPNLETRRNDARTQCLLNPTGPTGSISGTAGLPGSAYSVAGMSGKLVYTAFDAGTGANQLRLFNSANNSVSALGGSTQPAYQPNLGMATVNGGGAIYGVYVNGGFNQVANVGGLWPSISPDGSRVAYVLYDNGEASVYVARVDGSLPPISITKGTWPVWGPSGRIAFQGCPDRCGIHLIHPDVPNEVQQLTNSAGDVNMQWSPSGNELVYASNYSGAWAIYRVNLSNQFFQLTSGGEASTPTFSPDGSRIAFASNREGSWAIYIMNIDGSNAQKLIDLGPNHSSWQYDRMAWLP
jgi:TolB protein